MPLSLKEAQTVVEFARAHAEMIGVPMNIAVVDGGGHLLVFARMDGSILGSIDIALKKRPTKVCRHQPDGVDAGGNRGVDSRQEKGNAMSNKKIVLEALSRLFVRRDVSVLDTHFAPDYRQHNPTIGNGVAGLREIAPKLSPNLKYEPGMIVEDGDIVMIHGRYLGWAEKPLVAVDIFRVRDGKLVEHWDVMQEEVPASATVSGNPMFTLPA